MSQPTNNEWFVVDKEGLAQTLARRGAWYAAYELYQNGADADGVSRIEVEIAPTERRGRAQLVVRDDAPDGFSDLTHAYRLFAPSGKKGDAEKRGRFNLGEKLVLAICDEAAVRSTTGGYLFDAAGRTKIRNGQTERGSVFSGIVRMTRQEVEETERRMHRILPPDGLTLTVNGREVEHRTPIHSFTVTLPTELADDEGRLRPTERRTTIRVYEPVGDDEPGIYEMGIPVVAIEDRYIVDVGQKVPLNMDRDNVTPSYLRKVRTAVLNEMAARLTAEEATGTWVKEALVHAEAAVVETVVAKLYGPDAVRYDLSDPEANKLAAAAGRTVIPPGAFDRATWARVRETGTFLPAGQVTPSAKVTLADDGKPPIPEADWTAGQRRIVAYSQAVAKALMGCEISVRIDSLFGATWAAAYGPGHLRFNLARLGHRFFDQPDEEKVDALLIHEFGHHYSGDHLSDGYFDALCTLGARMKANAATLAAAWAAGQ